jgi:hypothetical protein
MAHPVIFPVAAAVAYILAAHLDREELVEAVLAQLLRQLPELLILAEAEADQEITEVLPVMVDQV